MLGKYSFVIQYHGFAFSYADIAAQLQPIWEEELDHIYIFVPYFSPEPMQEHTRYPASNGLTVVLQRDVLAPACILEPAEAFRLYELWGLDVDHLDQPPTDLPWPVKKIQLTIDDETGVYSIGNLDPTLPVLCSLANRFFLGVSASQVQIARSVPDRHVWYGEPVSHLSAISSVPRSPGKICVFLVMRGIGRESLAAWIQQNDFTRLQILTALQLDIVFIPCFKISITGGTQIRGRIVCQDGDVLLLNFVPDTGDPEASESETLTSDDDAEYPESRDNPRSAGCDDADVHPVNGAAASHDQLIWDPQRNESQHGNGSTVGVAMVDTWNLDVSMTGAVQSGSRGDTSTDNANQRLHAGYKATPTKHGNANLRDGGVRKSGITSGIRLYLAGLIFMRNLVHGCSVILPFSARDAHDHPLQENSGPLQDDFSGQGTQAACTIPADWYGANNDLLGWAWQHHIMPPADDTWPFDDEHLLTLLDQAKGEEFYRLCGELAWFFSTDGCWPWRDNVGNADHAVPHVHSSQSCVQCKCQAEVSVACQMSQTVGPTERPCPQSFANAKVTIELASVVEPPAVQTDCGQSRISCGVDSAMLALLVEGHQLTQLCQQVELASNMHEHARCALRTTPVWNRVDAFSRIALFTDGSFKEGHELVAYAVVALLEVNGQWQFAGFLSGAIETSDPAIAMQANAHIAELCGMIHARLAHIAAGSLVPVEICYDCMSACQVMCFGSPKGSPIDRLVSTVDAVCLLQGLQPTWSHVTGHSGHPWNEVADHIARLQLMTAIRCPQAANDPIKGMLSEGYMKWLWLAIAADATPECWPVAHGDGSYHASVFSKGRQQGCALPQQELLSQHAFSIRAATYNTLSPRVAGQTECLEQHFGNSGCCILGLQECRQPSEGLEHGSHFFKFASPANKGQGGCQIWLSKHVHPGRDAAGTPLRWRPDTFVRYFSSHRCLSISGMAGNVRFGIIAAHAHTASAEKDDISQFWQVLTVVIGQLPETSIKILLIDANASFDPHCCEGAYYRPLDDNAHAMATFLAQTSMLPSDLWDEEGSVIKTWKSPTGFEKALDYICVPQEMVLHLRTIGTDHELLDLFAGIDHRPLVVKFSFATRAKATRRDKGGFDVKAMLSEEGHQKLREIFSGAPQVPWETHACDHWEQLQAYLSAQCAQAFPLKSRGPRKTYISDELWGLIANQRQVRGQLRFRNQQHRKNFLWVCLRSWAIVTNGNRHLGFDHSKMVSQFCDRSSKHDHHVAILWDKLTSLRKDIGRLMKQCQAERARQAFQCAREEGPGAISRLMTALLKSGRRYKPPHTLPPLQDSSGNLLSEPEEVFRALGQHFAKAERAVEIGQSAFLDFVSLGNAQAAAKLDGDIVPGVAELSAAFRKVKAGKAPGASGLKPEIFRSASTSAAIAVYPILLKQMMRGEVPVAFLRSQICPIPKPGKCPANVEGWRSIALQEIPRKAVCATMRRFLLQALDNTALPLQLGGRPGGPMVVPALHVVAHLRRMRQLRKSAGVLYIDGVQAFYSAIREIVTGADETEVGAARIVGIIEDMHTDEQVRADLFRLLCGPSVLAQAGAPPFVQSFLRTGFHGSHFCVGENHEKNYLTQAGTIPGSPLADIVFQLALVRFHRNLQERLRAQDLLVTIACPSPERDGAGQLLAEASTSTWVDDLAVVVGSSSAAGLVPKLARVAAVVEQSLLSTGVHVNYSPGKTAAMCFFRGKGARNIRKFWAIEQMGRVQLPFGPGQGKWLQLVSEYTHLGSRWHASGSQTAAIAHRHSIAKPLFAALRKRLLFNDCLTRCEKVRLMVQGPLASMLHGAGLWVTTDKATARSAYEAVADMYRQCVRPILKISSRGLNNTEVCQALGVLEPADAIRFQRMRASISVAPLVDNYLAATLAQEWSWVQLVISDWAGVPDLDCPVDPACTSVGYAQVWLFFQWISGNARRLRLHINCLINRQISKLAASSDSVLQKALLLDGVFSCHAISWKQPSVRTELSLHVACPECHKVVHGPAALAAHRSKTHGIVSLGSLLSDHTMCPVCLIEFWSPARLWEHMRKAERCRRVFEASDPCLQPTCKLVGKATDLPAVRLQGPREWWTTLQPPLPVSCMRPVSSRFHTRVAIAWDEFCSSFLHASSVHQKAQYVHTLWREVLWALQFCDDAVGHHDPILGPAQHELERIIKACQGHSVFFRGFVLATFDRHHWIVPEQARGGLTRLVESTMHVEFTSPHLP